MSAVLIMVIIIGVPPLRSDHSYSKVATSERQGTSAIGYTTLAVGGGTDVGPLEATLDLTEDTTPTTVQVGYTVNLLSSDYRQIGTADTMTGDTLHGHKIPPDYVKVAVKKMQADGIKSLLGGNDEPLTAGSITAWPVKYTKKVQL